MSSREGIPVSKAYGSYHDGVEGFIFISKAEGQSLASILGSLTKDKIRYLATQLSACMRDWRDITADYYGAVGKGPCEDAFFDHCPTFGRPRKTYGPYFTCEEFNRGLADALEHARPTSAQVSDDYKALLAKVTVFMSEEKVLTLGDLHPYNILVDE